MQTSARDIVRVFSAYMRSKYRPMQVDKECVRTMIQAGRGRFSDGSRETLELPTTAEEVKAAMFVGDRKNLPAGTV